jgi:hypothetical protein
MSTPHPLDPWLDAKPISQRLRNPGAILTVALGAEAWCERCMELRPIFEMSMAEHETRLWLDLDEHADFLGGYLPEELPLILQWIEGRLSRIAVLEGTDESQTSPVPTARLRELPLSTEPPNLWSVLTKQDWAQ